MLRDTACVCFGRNMGVIKPSTTEDMTKNVGGWAAEQAVNTTCQQAFDYMNLAELKQQF